MPRRRHGLLQHLFEILATRQVRRYFPRRGIRDIRGIRGTRSRRRRRPLRALDLAVVATDNDDRRPEPRKAGTPVGSHPPNLLDVLSCEPIGVYDPKDVPRDVDLIANLDGIRVRLGVPRLDTRRRVADQPLQEDLAALFHLVRAVR